MDKKSQGLSLNVIIIAIIVLIVLVILISLVTGKLGLFTQDLQKGKLDCYSTSTSSASLSSVDAAKNPPCPSGTSVRAEECKDYNKNTEKDRFRCLKI